MTEPSDRNRIEQATGTLFGDLWAPYDEKLFDDSVELFRQRLARVGWDEAWFRGKRCLDAGCGGGRNSIAMAKLGAAHVSGIDLGANGIQDATKRAASRGLANTDFRQASILDIPFDNETFDLVWCAGVLMVTADPDRALDELTRVVKPGGKLYLLVYATEGMRWPLIEALRPLAAELGQPRVEAAMQAAQSPANKRRTFLDDLFCPVLDFYSWQRMRSMLEKRGFASIERWGVAARMDHEQNLDEYRKDLEALEAIYRAGVGLEGDATLFRTSEQIVAAAIESIRWFSAEVAAGRMTEEAAMTRVIGQGHHRVVATRP